MDDDCRSGDDCSQLTKLFAGADVEVHTRIGPMVRRHAGDVMRSATGPVVTVSGRRDVYVNEVVGVLSVAHIAGAGGQPATSGDALVTRH